MQHTENQQIINEKDQENDIMIEKKYTKWKKITIIAIIIFIITGIIILVYFTIRNKDSSIEEKNLTEYTTCETPNDCVSVSIQVSSIKKILFSYQMEFYL